MAKTFWHNLSEEEVIEILGTDSIKGLSAEQVSNRLVEFGENKFPREKVLSQFKIFLSQFKSPLIYILVIAGFVTLAFKALIDAIVIFGAVFLNTVIGYFQESKASKALKELKKVIKVEAEVIRDGNEMMIDSSELVPGDIIVLTAGNKVPVDGRLIENHSLKINEAPLTGEWLSAEKITNPLPKETPMADRDNMVYMGCVVEEGKGKAIVTETGLNTEIGKVAALVGEVKEEETPLQKKLAHFGKIVGAIILVVCFLIFITGIITGVELMEIFIVSVALAVAAVPSGLPVVMTVILAIGMQRILKRKGLVRKLVAAETLGSTSIACTDKTLTLTQGKMEVSATITQETEIEAQGKISWSKLFKKKADKNQLLLMQIAALTNEAFVENPREERLSWRVRGRPTDKALLLAGAEVGLKKWEIEESYSKIDEISFNPLDKFIANLYQEDKKGILYLVGAPEKVFSLSGLDENTFLRLNQKLKDLTSQGLRVLAAAFREFSVSSGQLLIKEEIKDLTFIGFIGLKDPLRKEAKEAIALCKKAGMKPIIITGDHLLTAKAIGKELGLKTKKENIIEGKELEKMSDEELQNRVKDIEIYARVEPGYKLRIVEAWQRRGEVVAMTGDGINDAPALKQADVGVALGSGTDVAKEVSDLILLTDDFSIIPAAVGEGRAIIDNLRKVITYLLSTSVAEVVLIAVTLPFGFPIPLLAAQILWINLIEGALPAFALGMEPQEKDIMERKPEGKSVSLLIKESKALIFIIVLFASSILLFLFSWLFHRGYDLAYIRTMIFACLSLNSLFYIFSCRSFKKNIWQMNPFSNKYLIGAWAFAIIMLFLAVYFPPLQTLLRTVPLRAQDWLIFLGFGIVGLALIEATKWYLIAKSKFE